MRRVAELLRGCRMALCVPCGGGDELAALRDAGVPAVGIDEDGAAVQRCRDLGLVAWPLSWRAVAGHAERFDAVVADVGALRLDAAAVAECAAVLGGALLPGGQLVLWGDGAGELAAAAAAAGLVPHLTANGCVVLRRGPRPVPTSPGYVVGPYADLFVGCGDVLEIGCGQGRFLDALAMRDLRVQGCEQDAAAVAAARARGHTVLAGGLGRAADAGAKVPCGGVFVGPVVEALADHQLPALLAVCRRALHRGGRLVVRARRGAAAFGVLQQLARDHGFGVWRSGRAPGDARDAFAVGVADSPGSVAAAAATGDLDAIALPTSGLPIDAPLRSPFDLERFERRVTSQTGEDGVLAALFARVGTTNRHYVEFGCGDGVQCNTAQLRRAGWRGLLLDGVAAPGAPDAVIHAAWITAENIESLFDQHDVPQEPDLMSIDLDGNDFWVWRAIRRRPRVVVAEYNANLGPDAALTIPYDPQHRWDGTDWYGASLRALVLLARRKGYTLVHCTQSGVNAFFVRDDLLRGEPAPDVASLHRPPNYWYRGARQPPNLARTWQRVDDATCEPGDPA